MNIRELRELEKIYKSGEWICAVRYTDISQDWHIAKEPFQDTINEDLEIKLIHKKHQHILDAYIKGEAKKIESYRWSDLIEPFNENCIDTFIEEYDPEYFYYVDNKNMKPLDDNIMDLIDNKPKNNFKDYGFEADFEGEILKKVEELYIGWVNCCLDYRNITPCKWTKYGKNLSTIQTGANNRNLTPIKKEWWEDHNCLNKIFYDTVDDRLVILDWIDYKGNVRMQNSEIIFRHERFRIASKEEIKILYYKEK